MGALLATWTSRPPANTSGLLGVPPPPSIMGANAETGFEPVDEVEHPIPLIDSPSQSAVAHRTILS